MEDIEIATIKTFYFLYVRSTILLKIKEINVELKKKTFEKEKKKRIFFQCKKSASPKFTAPKNVFCTFKIKIE